MRGKKNGGGLSFKYAHWKGQISSAQATESPLVLGSSSQTACLVRAVEHRNAGGDRPESGLGVAGDRAHVNTNGGELVLPRVVVRVFLLSMASWMRPCTPRIQ